MKLQFFQRTPSDQFGIIQETAARRGVLPVMVEKDFWVSWLLGVLFAHQEFREQLVFKGGTSLSKVFRVIERFSEDIDLSVSPGFLGISEESVEQASTRRQRTERMKELESACTAGVRERFLPELERIASNCLGKRPAGGNLSRTTMPCATCFSPRRRGLKALWKSSRSWKTESTGHRQPDLFVRGGGPCAKPGPLSASPPPFPSFLLNAAHAANPVLTLRLDFMFQWPSVKTKNSPQFGRRGTLSPGHIVAPTCPSSEASWRRRIPQSLGGGGSAPPLSA